MTNLHNNAVRWLEIGDRIVGAAKDVDGVQRAAPADIGKNQSTSVDFSALSVSAASRDPESPTVLVFKGSANEAFWMALITQASFGRLVTLYAEAYAPLTCEICYSASRVFRKA